LSCETSPVSEEEEQEDLIQDLPPLGSNLSEDIANFWNQGFNLDDDREPAPENVPTEDETPTQVTDLKEGQSWGWDAIDHRAIVKPEKEGHTFKNNFSHCGVFFQKLYYCMLCNHVHNGNS
jgi:hypothetical protein